MWQDFYRLQNFLSDRARYKSYSSSTETIATKRAYQEYYYIRWCSSFKFQWRLFLQPAQAKNKAAASNPSLLTAPAPRGSRRGSLSAGLGCAGRLAAVARPAPSPTCLGRATARCTDAGPKAPERKGRRRRRRRRRRQTTSCSRPVWTRRAGQRGQRGGSCRRGTWLTTAPCPPWPFPPAGARQGPAAAANLKSDKCITTIASSVSGSYMISFLISAL